MTLPSKCFQIPDDQYHKIDALSSSKLRDLALSTPRQTWLKKQYPEGESDDMRFGTLFHMAILEPERFKDTVICEPDALPDGTKAGRGAGLVDRNTNKWKDFIREWREKNTTKTHIDPSDFRLLCMMMDSVNRHPIAQPLLKSADKEIATLWTSEDGDKCKAKADLLHEKYLADFKTTKCETPEAFNNDCYRRLVHVQVGFYDWGFGKAGFKFDDHYVIGVSKAESCGEVATFVCKVEENLLQRGYEKAMRLLDLYRKCRLDNHWPGHEKLYQLSVPSWDIIDIE
jgi:exodeoxyribonuclease VIII